MKLSVVDQSPVPSGLTPADALRNTIDLARLCEGLGYTRYWLAEHHASLSFAGSAPEIMIARVAAETSRIRVGSGAVLLPHYAPLKVVEQFRVLHALYPDRIDLGIGRAPGGGGLDAYALRRHRGEEVLSDDFGHQLPELLAFLHAGFPSEHPFSNIQVSPAMPGAPEVWLLGSSGWSASAAAQLGLPFATAHFINPVATRRSIEYYHENFRPSDYLDAPQALIAIGAICADTEAEAQRLYTSQRLRRRLRDLGERGPIPSPEEAVARLGESPEVHAADDGEWPRIVVGSVDHVHEQLSHIAGQLSLDELMVITVVHDHDARKHSYELLAGAFGLDSTGALTPSRKAKG
jgi:luciferase family oxidoreductase group 1